MFLRDEAPALRPLPAFRFEMATLKKARVAPNYHVQVDGCFYSVPFTLIGKTLDVRLTRRLVEVFDQATRVASHPRLTGRKGAYQTTADHMPAHHQAQASQWTPARFTGWAAQAGEATRQVVEAILASKPVVEQSYRSCLGLMSLARKPGGLARLEDTCAKALELTPAPSYTLVKRLWPQWRPVEPQPRALTDQGFVRGAGYYDQDGAQS